MRIRIDAISSEGIDQYNMLRIGPDGEHLPINGIDWQDSNVFSGMPTGGGWILQARDVNGNIAEKVVPKEEPLEITAYGGYIQDGEINISMATNIPSQMHMTWGIPDSEGHIEQEDLGWNQEFSNSHTRYLPVFYMDAEHHYWISARSQLGQTTSVNGRYVITPNDILISKQKPVLLFSYTIHEPELYLREIHHHLKPVFKQGAKSGHEKIQIQPALNVTGYDDIEKSNREIKGSYITFSYEIT